MLIEHDWLNMLVDRENKGYVIQADQYDLITAYLGMVDQKDSCLFFSWTKTGYDFEALA
jgi:hypothetical protein